MIHTFYTVAIMENFQEDDYIKVPDVLVPYTGFSRIGMDDI